MSLKVKSALSLVHHKLRMIGIVFVCFWGITIFFMASSFLSDVLGTFLRVDPSYTGGEVSAVFYTEVSGAAFEYTVHQPVTNARWQQSAEYWQLVLNFDESVSLAEEVSIYIGLDNQNQYHGQHQNVQTYDFAVQLKNGAGKVYDREGTFITDVEYYALKDGKQIKFRIPLSDKRLQKILGAKKTSHTIVINGESSDFFVVARE